MLFIHMTFSQLLAANGKKEDKKNKINRRTYPYLEISSNGLQWHEDTKNMLYPFRNSPVQFKLVCFQRGLLFFSRSIIALRLLQLSSRCLCVCIFVRLCSRSVSSFSRNCIDIVYPRCTFALINYGNASNRATFM